MVAFSLGANLGDAKAALRRAVERLSAITRNPRVASLYRTAPLRTVPQPDFLNSALIAESDLGPQALLLFAQTLEREAGRQAARPLAGGPPPPPGPRPLDIDLLWYGDLVLAERDLELPHPRLRERRFVLEPLVEIAPQARLPPDGLTVIDVYNRLLASGGTSQVVERIAAPGWERADRIFGA